MKPIKFDLPLNGIRIGTLDQLEENLTPEILQHFRSGKLAKWLRVRALDGQADRIEALLAADIENEVQLFKNVCEVFVGEVDENDAREAICEYNVSIELKNTVQSIPYNNELGMLQHLSSGKFIKCLWELNYEQADAVEALLATDIEDPVQLFKSVCEVFFGELDENKAIESIEEFKSLLNECDDDMFLQRVDAVIMNMKAAHELSPVEVYKNLLEIVIYTIEYECRTSNTGIINETQKSKLSEESSEKFKFYDENMGFFERVAFTAFAAVALPFAAVAEGYEMLTKDDEKKSSGGY